VSSAYLNTVADTNWKIVGTGDFNNDAKGDILWRNISTVRTMLGFITE